jgi:uncharacterized protein with GYD domain
MALYLLQVSYTAEGWATQLRNPQNRIELLRPVFDTLGGSLDQAWYTFGDYDVVAIMELPDNVSAAAFSMAAMSGGSVRAIKTTPLLTVDDGIEAMHVAAELGYRPPSNA